MPGKSDDPSPTLAPDMKHILGSEAHANELPAVYEVNDSRERASQRQ